MFVWGFYRQRSQKPPFCVVSCAGGCWGDSGKNALYVILFSERMMTCSSDFAIVKVVTKMTGTFKKDNYCNNETKLFELPTTPPPHQWNGREIEKWLMIHYWQHVCPYRRHPWNTAEVVSSQRQWVVVIRSVPSWASKFKQEVIWFHRAIWCSTMFDGFYDAATFSNGGPIGWQF